MTAGTIAAHRAVVPGANAAVTRVAMRQLRRGTLLVAPVCAVMSAMVAFQYKSTFERELDQAALRALTENPAIRILFGTPAALDDPGGFTVWRTGIPLLMLAGVWIMLASIRITRGEEEAGRWSLLLAGTLRASDALRSCLVALVVSATAVGAGVGAGLLLAGTDTLGALSYAAGVLGVTLTFATVGLVAAQVMPSRSSAVGLAAGYLTVALLIRMLADGMAAMAWSAWLSPLGLIARVAPYAENRVAPLLVLACNPVVLATIAMAASRHRDVGGGLLTLTTHRPPRTRLLGSVGGFAVRRAVRPSVGWVAGIGAYFLIVGAMIASILEFFEGSPRFAELAAGAGFAGLDTAEGFAAALFGLLAIPTGLYGASRLGSLAGDEKARHWTMVFASPVPRVRVLVVETVTAATGIVILHATAAVAMWGGAALTGAPLRLVDAAAGALNTAAIAGLALGAAALALGWLPSAVVAVGAVPGVGGFLVNIVAESTRAPDWLRNASPFVHIAAVPSVSPGWAPIVALLAIGAVMALIGLVGYDRRDVTS
ncbi:polyketide antibiotic transporter [Mycobacterium deserti]|uniref:Polyketide antibiotic transporter n=1 Tax=Mycobacterium deserti TaxID=2978347 RepID=A0ABT2MBB4_9MYCO|nr:polyketide antibiotic transporter [Mycobacterium deserti]MCT7659563.1 polyketide antibiotic transporter [Mycobacterium deserti]